MNTIFRLDVSDRMKRVLLTLINILLLSKTCQSYKVGYRDVMMAKEMAEDRDHHPRGQEHPHRHHPRGTVAVDTSMAGIMDQIFTKEQGRGVAASAESMPSMGKFKSVVSSSRSKVSSSEPSSDSLSSMGKFKPVQPNSSPIRSKMSSKPLSASESKPMDASNQREAGSLSASKLLKSSVRQEHSHHEGSRGV